MANTPDKHSAGGGLSGIVVKAGVIMCLVSILFGMIVMVKGMLFSDGDKDADIPEVFAYMGAGSCGLFTLGALMALVGWLAGVVSEK